MTVQTVLMARRGQWLCLDLNGKETLWFGVGARKGGVPVLFAVRGGDVTSPGVSISLCWGLVELRVDRAHPGPDVRVVLDAPEQVGVRLADELPAEARTRAGSRWVRDG